MARVTVEDCVKLIPNRFELSLIAGRRAKDLLSGSPALIDKKDEKYTVTALREIGKQLVDIENIKHNLEEDANHVKVINYEDGRKKSKNSEGEFENDIDEMVGAESEDENYGSGDADDDYDEDDDYDSIDEDEDSNSEDDL